MKKFIRERQTFFLEEKSLEKKTPLQPTLFTTMTSSNDKDVIVLGKDKKLIYVHHKTY